MPKCVNVTLDNHLEQFVDRQIESGHYESVNEAIHAGLKLLEAQETKLEQLRQDLIEGEESGIADYSLNELIEELDKE